MTVKEGEHTNIGPYKMCKLCPALSSNYYEHLIQDKSDNFMGTWDLSLGIHDLSASFAKLKKAWDKKNGIEEKEYDTKDLYHMQID